MFGITARSNIISSFFSSSPDVHSPASLLRTFSGGHREHGPFPMDTICKGLRGLYSRGNLAEVFESCVA